MYSGCNVAVSARRAKILVKDHSCEIIEGNLPEYKLHTVFVGMANDRKIMITTE